MSVEESASTTMLIAPAIPGMIVTALSGSGAGEEVGAPNLLVPMWGLLFGSLAWSFFEFGLFADDLRVGFLLGGVMFAAFAFPALLPVRTLFRSEAWRASVPGRPGLWWWTGCYVGLFSVGASLGIVTYSVIG